MVRGRTAGRSQPSLMTKFNWERDTTPASGPHGYYFRWNDGLEAYDLSSYNSEYSDHQINEQMIVTFFKEVHAIKLLDPKKTNFLHWINILNLVGGLVATGLFFLLGYSQPTTKSYQISQNRDCKVVNDVDSTSHLIYTPMVAMAHFLLGFLSWLFVNVFRIEKMRLGRLAKRVLLINEVFERHKATTFSGLRVSITTGAYGAYIGLKFDWKQANHMAMLAGQNTNNGGFPMPMGYNAPSGTGMSFNAPPNFSLA